jgi:hypothetical protein
MIGNKSIADTNFEIAIRRLDLGLFSRIESQTVPTEKESLLVMQKAVRNSKETFVYLEIGSHLGGSIQPYFLDPKCIKIFSIDKRTEIQADERFSEGSKYLQNTTQRMLDNLRKLSEEKISKIVTFDSDASDVDKTKITLKPDICFIDGEHTNSRAVSDFIFCKSVISRDGVIVFHDSSVIFQGIKSILKKLKQNHEIFKAYFLSDTLFVISFSNAPIDNDENIKLLRRKLIRSNIKKWIFWSIFPNIITRERLSQYKRRFLKF